ncbi:MAG: DNA polymerase III subunit alpha [Firmicutes bacterium]|nr:DNA polymerase III subunit alpha [Bacillota bacterium]
MKQFVHLHLHTEYSLLDGAARIDRLFEHCHANNMPAVAITDHGNMFGVVEFFKHAIKFTNNLASQKNDPEQYPKYDLFEIYKSSIKYGVKPIFGCELYVCPDMDKRESTTGGKMPKLNHLVFLAKNMEGYRNLVKLVSLSYTQGFYYKPRVDFETIKKYSKGLICLSACLAGEIPQALLNDDYESAKEIAYKYKKLFGDDFYIELQDHSMMEQKKILPSLIKLGRECQIKLVATNDVHYIEKDDGEMQKVLQCINFRTTIDEERKIGEEEKGAFSTPDYYLKNGDEMARLFAAAPDAVDNTLEIANKCEGLFFAREKLLPLYTPPDAIAPYDYLRKLTFDGLTKRYGEKLSTEVTERAEYELGIISRLGFVDYFLIVWDFIDFAERNGISVGPGRGSGVGSIVAYATGITKVDPLKFDLIFERFLNSERISSPDFDIDFCVDRRDEVIRYVVDKYGADKVAQIVTFGTMAAKAAIKDVARVYSVPYSDVDRVTKLMPNMGGASIAQILGLKKSKKEGEVLLIPDIKEIYQNDETMRGVFDMAMRLEGMPRQPGMHAAGVVICRDAISDHIPLMRSNDGIITTQFDMIECEELGLLKMDFLGLRTLTDVQKTIEFIKQNKGVTIDFYNMNYNDAGVFELIGEGDTHAVFQLESEGMKRFMRDLKPNCIEDIIAGVALYRPGPMDSIPKYVKNKKNPRAVQYDHPILEPILGVTYGVIIYQEQVMRIVREMGGYTLGRADIVRRIMSKKIPKEMQKEEIVFLNGTEVGGISISGALAKGVPEQVARKVFGEMSAFAEYAFNKSHAAAYAFLAYQTAYLKRYYPVEFITAVLNNRIGSIKDIQNYLSYLKARGIVVLPPDINKSASGFSVEGDSVRIGLTALKSVGEGIIEDIITQRQKGDFVDFYSFLERMQDVKINKRQLESMVWAGVFDCWGHKRSQLEKAIPIAVDKIAGARESRMRGQFDMFGAIDTDDEPIKFEDIPEYDLAERLRKEKEVTGIYISGHPLEEYEDFLKGFEFNTATIGADENDGLDRDKKSEKLTLGGMLVQAERRLTKKGAEMGIGRLEDLHGSVELMVSPSSYERIKDYWKPDTIVTVIGRLNDDEDAKIWVERVTPLQGNKKNEGSRRKLCVKLTQTEMDSDTFEEIKKLAGMYPGHDDLYFKNLTQNQLLKYPYGVTLGGAFEAQLYGLVDFNAIEIKD